MSESLILADKPQLPIFTFGDTAKELRDLALNGAALIGKVSNAAENQVAVKAQVELKRVMAMFEKSRKALKEPLLEAGRQLDRLVAAESVDLEKEYGRLTNALSEFQLAEQRRVQEEERLQREEIARIEREKQAELKRIADEQAAREAEARRVQAEIDRKAREAQEAAEKLASEAKNKKQREAAEKLMAESKKAAEAAALERQNAAILLAQQQKAAQAAMAKTEETAAAATYVESRPVQATRQAGQVVKTDWEITVTNPWELAKFHPNAVKIEPMLGEIKQMLNEGVTVRGISAKKVTKATVRVGAPILAIDV